MYRLMTPMVSDHLFKAVRGKLGASYGIHPGLGIYRGGAAYLTASGNINNSSIGVYPRIVQAIRQAAVEMMNETADARR